MTERSPTPGPGDAPPSHPRIRRWMAWPLGIVLGLVVLFVAALVALQQPRIATSVTNAVLVRVHLLPRAALHVDEVRGDWLTHLELSDVRLARGDTVIAVVDRLRLRYRLASLLSGTIRVLDLDVDGAWVTADIVDTTRTAPKKPSTQPLTLAGVFRGRFYSGPALRIDRLSVRRSRYGGHAASPDSMPTLSQVEIRVQRLRLGRGFSFDLDSLVASGRPVETSRARIDIDLRAMLDQGRFEARTLRFRTDSSSVEDRSEERRVGKECRSRWSPYH